MPWGLRTIAGRACRDLVIYRWPNSRPSLTSRVFDELNRRFDKPNQRIVR